MAFSDYDSEINNPFYSICIPIYNSENYLDECINSVLEQSEKSYEVILVDDGSTDNSGAICDNYSEKYQFIRTIHKQNEGLFLARYDAVKVAKGAFLLFLDSDDFFYPGALQRIKMQIQKFHVDLVLFDLNDVFNDGRIHRKTESYPADELFVGEGKNQIYIDLVAGNGLNSLVRKCVRSDLLDFKITRDDFIGLIQGEDKLFSVICIDKAERISYLKEALYGYRINQESTTHNASLSNYKSVQTVYGFVNEYVKKWNLPEAVIHKQDLRRVTFGVNCVLSILLQYRREDRKSGKFREAVIYIGQDTEFRNAYGQGITELSLYQKLAVKMITRKKYKLLKIYFYAINGPKTILRKVYNAIRIAPC